MSEIQSVCPSPDIISSPFGSEKTFQVLSSEAVAKKGLRGWTQHQLIEAKWTLNYFIGANYFQKIGSNSVSLFGLTRF